MRVVCVSNRVTEGVFFKKDKTHSLTVGKVYEAHAVPICSNVTVTDATNINPEDIMFLVFNDRGVWNVYDTDFFEPETK